MIDLARLLEQFDAGSASGSGPGRGQELGIFPNQGPEQDTEKIDISHISQFPTGKREIYRDSKCALKIDHDDSDDGITRDEHACTVGNVGTAGNPSKNNDLPFPLIYNKLGNWEKERGETASAALEETSPPLLDPNHGAPSRSDWWTGLAMAEVDQSVSAAGTPLPISPADVRAGVTRELRALAEDGRSGPDALRDAVAITAAKIRNAPALAERQVHDGLCHHCGEPLDDARPMVAVLQAGGHLWVHGGACHDTLSQRRAALVAQIMEAAGYGPKKTGEPA